MTTDVSAPAPAPAEPKPNSIARIIGVLFSPDETFASIAKRPTWAAPLILLILVSVASGIVMAPRVDWAGPAREQMESRTDISAEQKEAGMRMAGAMGKVITYAGPILAIIFMLILAGILLLAFRLFGGEGTFAQAWSATLYAYVPNCIKSIVVLIVMVIKGGDKISPMALPTLLRSNLAFLFDPKDNPMAFALAGQFDIFSIWVLILIIIAFAHLAKVSKGKSAAIVISLWIIKCLLSLIGPAIQSLRRK